MTGWVVIIGQSSEPRELAMSLWRLTLRFDSVPCSCFELTRLLTGEGDFDYPGLSGVNFEGDLL